MRICLITPELPPYTFGGIGTYVAALARGYAKRGHEITVVGAGIHDTGVKGHDWGVSQSLCYGRTISTIGNVIRAPFDGIASVANWLDRRASLPGLWRLPHLWCARQSVVQAKLIRQYMQANANRFDIVEYSNWPGNCAFIPRSRARRVVRLSTPAADTYQLGKAAFDWLESRACRLADIVVANSEAMRRKAIEQYRLIPERTVVVHHGVEEATILSQPCEGEVIRVVCVGRAEARKGTDLLLKALLPVLRRYVHVHVTFIGADIESYVSDKPDLREMWAQLKVECEGRVMCLGKLADAERDKIVSGSHWTVIPSRFESFGLVAVESLRFGTPIMAADVGGLGEVASLVPDSVVFLPNDVNSIIGAFDRVAKLGIDGAMCRRSLAKRAFQQHFSAERMIDESLALYRRLL